MPLLQQESLNMMIVITVMNNVRVYNVDRDILREVQHACTPFLKFSRGAETPREIFHWMGYNYQPTKY